MKTGIEKLFIRLIIIIIENLHFYVKQILISVFFKALLRLLCHFVVFLLERKPFVIIMNDVIKWLWLVPKTLLEMK